MPKPKDQNPYQPIAQLLATIKGRRFVLDCGHKAIIGDQRSNTIIITNTGKTLCHNCGY